MSLTRNQPNSNFTNPSKARENTSAQDSPLRRIVLVAMLVLACALLLAGIAGLLTLPTHLYSALAIILLVAVVAGLGNNTMRS